MNGLEQVKEAISAALEKAGVRAQTAQKRHNPRFLPALPGNQCDLLPIGTHQLLQPGPHPRTPKKAKASSPQ